MTPVEHSTAVGTAKVPSSARARGFAAALIVIALAAGGATVLGAAALALRITAVLFAAATCVVGVAVMAGGRSRRLFPVAALATCTVALFLGAKEFSPSAPPVPQAQWQVATVADPDVGVRYVPNTTGQTFFPDNPRGYFEQTDPIRETWSLETQKGSAAQLDYSAASSSPSMRVTIAKIEGNENWRVKLQQTGFHITKGDSYVLTFRAKADAPRPIACVVGHNHEPWGVLGLYAELAVQTGAQDFKCPFVATETDANARVFFNLASSQVPVEFSNVVLHNETQKRDETPFLKPKRFFVSYRFNSLGFRGTDPVMPRPAGTFRIVALGNSATQGVGVREPDTFEVQLQNRLNQAGAGRDGATKYEVINAGVSGYATREELRSYQLFSSKYEPQLVLLTMTTNDDMSYLDAVQRGRTYDYSDSVRALKELDAACRQHGAKLAVVLFANTPSNLWDKLANAVTAGLQGTGVPILNLKSALVHQGDKENALVVDVADGDPNEIAQRLASEQIEQFLRNEHLLP